MKKFTQRVLILGAAEMAIIGAVGGVGLLGRAQAIPATCTSVTGQCQPQQLSGPQSRIAIACQPIGPKSGAACRQVMGHPA
jgi:hypothetical protein